MHFFFHCKEFFQNDLSVMTSTLYWKIFLCFWQWYTNYCLYIFNSLICHILGEKWFWFQTKLKCMTKHIMKYVVSLNPVVDSVIRKLFSWNQGTGVPKNYDCICRYAHTLVFVVKPHCRVMPCCLVAIKKGSHVTVWKQRIAVFHGSVSTQWIAWNRGQWKSA